MTSRRSGRVAIVMSSSTPAISLTLTEPGPATLTTMGACSTSPSARRAPRARDAAARRLDPRDLHPEAEAGAVAGGGVGQDPG